MSQRPDTDGAAKFLREALAEGAVGVPELEARAHAAGLLRHGQRISQATVFKGIKKSLGIRSVRHGFGPNGEWSWVLPGHPPLATNYPSAEAAADKVAYAEAQSGPAFAQPRPKVLSKRGDAPYRSARCTDWIKVKNAAAPAVRREDEEDSGSSRWRQARRKGLGPPTKLGRRRLRPTGDRSP